MVAPQQAGFHGGFGIQILDVVNRRNAPEKGPGGNDQRIRFTTQQRLHGARAAERQVLHQAVPDPSLPADQPVPAPDYAEVSVCLDLAQPPSPTMSHEPFRAIGKRAVDVDLVPVLNPVVDQLGRHHARRLPLGRVHRG